MGSFVSRPCFRGAVEGELMSDLSASPEHGLNPLSSMARLRLRVLDFPSQRGRLLSVLLVSVIVALALLAVAVSWGSAAAPGEARPIRRPTRPAGGSTPRDHAA